VGKGNGVVGRGLLAGFLAATTLIVWFFIIDLLAGAPLRTPGFLAAALLMREDPPAGTGTIAIYTVLHYGVFLALGALIARVVRSLQPRAMFLLGLSAGFLFFALMFWGAVLVSGVDVSRALGWPAMLVGSILAGLVLASTLQFTGVALPSLWMQTLRKSDILRQGTVAAMIGAGVVAVWFLVFDTITRVPFYTPAALGSAIFFGATGPAEVQITTASVLAYTILHVLGFLIVGLIAAAFINAAESSPALLLGLVLFFVVFQVAFIGVLTIGGIWILDTIGWWSVAGANLLAGLSILGYLWHAHPGLRDELEGPPLEEKI